MHIMKLAKGSNMYFSFYAKGFKNDYFFSKETAGNEYSTLCFYEPFWHITDLF